MNLLHAAWRWLYLTGIELAAWIEYLRRRRIRITRRDSQAWFIRCCALAALAGLARFSTKIVAIAFSVLHNVN
jgi:hypothetical protein